MDLRRHFDSFTSPRGRTTAFRRSRLPCWLSTGKSGATTASHRRAATLYTAARASVVREASSLLITYWNKRRLREWWTCFSVCGRWDKLALIWFRLGYALCLQHYYVISTSHWPTGPSRATAGPGKTIIAGPYHNFIPYVPRSNREGGNMGIDVPSPSD